MKIVLDIEVNGELKENDIIVFKDGRWKTISKKAFIGKHIADQKVKNDYFEKELNELKKDLSKLAKIVKEK